jgi:hypothetical protein
VKRNARNDARVAAVIGRASALAVENDLAVSGGVMPDGEQRFTATLPSGQSIRVESIGGGVGWASYRRNAGQDHWRYCPLAQLERLVAGVKTSAQ